MDRTEVAVWWGCGGNERLIAREGRKMKRLALLWRIVKGDARVLWYALRQPGRPVWLLPATVLLGLYALDPFNIALPLAGVIDDGIIVPLVLHLLVKCLPMEMRRAGRFEGARG
jgi:uncharacterized membrane protein YkvA (DUF1232 family)